MSALRARARCILVLLPCILWLLGAVSAPAQVSREYQLKAVFLFHFAQFTEWPTNAFDKPEDPLIIGVLGTDPFGRVLDEAIRGEKVNGRPLVAERYQDLGQMKKCHILFISQSEDRRIERIVEELKGRPILTVSDANDAARRGVMIRLITESNRIRFRVNMNSVNAARLSISSKLLRSAEIIPAERNP